MALVSSRTRSISITKCPPRKRRFGELSAATADDEMLDLALQIMRKKAGRFDPERLRATVFKGEKGKVFCVEDITA